MCHNSQGIQRGGGVDALATFTPTEVIGPVYLLIQLSFR